MQEDGAMSNYIFALDQSIACSAWCLFKDKNLAEFGCIKTKKDDGSLFERVGHVTINLFDAAKCNWSNTLFCREGLGFGGSNSNASRDLAYLVGAIETVFGEQFKEVAPTALKKFATGSGKADKQDMINALPEDIKQKFLDAGFKKTTGLSDLADAYFIGKYFMQEGYIYS